MCQDILDGAAQGTRLLVSLTGGTFEGPKLKALRLGGLRKDVFDRDRTVCHANLRVVRSATLPEAGRAGVNATLPGKSEAWAELSRDITG